MGKPHRSPLLGYNHNIGHLGKVFHVQTEDSGPVTPRLFSHLFFEGTILASRKLEYEALMPDDKVRALMQNQHKSLIRELMQSLFDEKIVSFFRARGEEVGPGVGALPATPMAESSPSSPALVAPLTPPPARQADPAAVVAAPAVASAPAPAVAFAPGPVVRIERVPEDGVPQHVSPRRTTRPIDTTADARGREPRGNSPAPIIVRQGDGRRPPFVRSGGPVSTKTASADGVVVQRSVVIGGLQGQRPARIRPPVPYVVTGGAHPVRPVSPATGAAVPEKAGAAPAAGPPPAAGEAPRAGGFGAALPDDKSLDEVILEYLAEDGD